jgi:hypothetical protein
MRFSISLNMIIGVMISYLRSFGGLNSNWTSCNKNVSYKCCKKGKSLYKRTKVTREEIDSLIEYRKTEYGEYKESYGLSTMVFSKKI